MREHWNIIYRVKAKDLIFIFRVKVFVYYDGQKCCEWVKQGKWTVFAQNHITKKMLFFVLPLDILKHARTLMFYISCKSQRVVLEELFINFCQLEGTKKLWRERHRLNWPIWEKSKYLVFRFALKYVKPDNFLYYYIFSWRQRAVLHITI